MSFSEYAELLGSMDAAVFGHHRNAAMSTIRILILNGSKVYMEASSNGYAFLKEIGIEVFSMEELSPERFRAAFTEEQILNNKEAINIFFGEEQTPEINNRLFN